MNYYIFETLNLRQPLEVDYFPSEYDKLPKGYVVKQIVINKNDYGNARFLIVCKKWWEFWK